MFYLLFLDTNPWQKESVENEAKWSLQMIILLETQRKDSRNTIGPESFWAKETFKKYIFCAGLLSCYLKKSLKSKRKNVTKQKKNNLEFFKIGKAQDAALS